MTELLTTKRCKLRTLNESDRENYVSLVCNDAVRRYLGGPSDKEHANEQFNRALNDAIETFWVIEKVRNHEFVGTISLDSHHDGKDIEISYQLMPEHWGNGLATEVVSRVLSYAFDDLKHERIVAETQSANVASRRLLEKIGMIEEKVLERFGEQQALYACFASNLTV